MSEEALGDRASSSGASSSTDRKAPFITHRVSKLDTLAGLAVRYNVTVSDIKRTNGLLSDSAMFARDTLLIPTESLQIGLEVSTWAGMIVTQYGKLPRSRPGSLGFASEGAHQSAALEQLRGYYGLAPSHANSAPAASLQSDLRAARSRSLTLEAAVEGSGGEWETSSAGEVEMSDLTNSPRHAQFPRRPSLPSLEYAGSRQGYSVDERLRRRHRTDSPLRDASSAQPDSPADNGEIQPASPPAAGTTTSNPAFVSRPPLFAGAENKAAHTKARSGQAEHQRSLARGRRESLLDKIKRAASQPALAQPSNPSIAKAAEGMVARAPSTQGGAGLALPPAPLQALQQVSQAVRPPKPKVEAKVE